MTSQLTPARLLRAPDAWSSHWDVPATPLYDSGVLNATTLNATTNSSATSSSSADLPFGLSIALLIASTIFTALGLNVEKLAHRKLDDGATIFHSLGNWVWWIGFLVFVAARESGLSVCLRGVYTHTIARL